MSFDKSIGQRGLDRMRVQYRADYGHGSAVTVHLRPGWNDGVEWQECPLSLDEARDLRYLLDSAIAHAEP